MNEQKITIEHNTCIISSNLLDEMDYVIGGYGQPTAEFIFNFNAFVEAYILSSNFILTQREVEHINITKKVLFPNGRPIFELLMKSKRVSVYSGFGDNIMQCVYVDKVPKSDNETAQKAIDTFCERDADRIKSNFILSDFSKSIDSVKTYSVGFTGKNEAFGGMNQVLIGETTNRPYEIVKSFFNTISNYNVQAALPVFTYQQQFHELGKKAISKEIYKTVCDIQGQTIEDAESYLGGELQTIPPLVSIVLSKSRNTNDIPDVLNQIREDFTDFRSCCEKFERTLNDAKTIREQVEAIKDYKKFWATLVKKYSDNTSRIMFRFLDIAKESDYENALDNIIDTQSADELFKDLNMGKVAGKAGLLAWDKIKEKRILNKFKGVVNLWSLLENAPTVDSQIKDIERVFKTKIDRNKISFAKKHLQTIRKNTPNNIVPQK
ncbi:MAG: hypothetical protein KA523_00090 [Flavobacterium sp.]|nr:hypothetical protein [Flavobacterium sp.]